ncbi:MAG TPA: hypothetical protein VJ577_05785 [Burkholderiaceae bacterium]|nr:hypothetical protein [Burkholderiaceae bacterium]
MIFAAANANHPERSIRLMTGATILQPTIDFTLAACNAANAPSANKGVRHDANTSRIQVR